MYLAFFQALRKDAEGSTNLKASTLWTYRSELNAEILSHFKVDMSDRTRLAKILTQWGKDEKTKKASIFDDQDIVDICNRFPDTGDGLQLKLCISIGVYGAMRKRELCALLMSDVECLLVVVVHTCRTAKYAVSITLVVSPKSTTSKNPSKKQ